jgi:hypothetical protein
VHAGLFSARFFLEGQSLRDCVAAASFFFFSVSRGEIHAGCFHVIFEHEACATVLLRREIFSKFFFLGGISLAWEAVRVL